MQVSILIPVYNYDCSALLQVITEDLREINNLTYEILIGNDASAEAYATLFAAYPQHYPHTSVIKFRENRGASQVRNALGSSARYAQLLFFDADVLPDKGTIKKYLEAMAKYPKVLIYGGFRYDKADLRADNRLRYRYGTQIEMRSLAQRKAKPYQSFITMAFALPKALLEARPFPKVGMGYEDALWGADLAKHKLAVQHIDAPVKHSLKEDDEAFLQTLARYVANLARHRTLFAEAHISLLRTYTFLESWHLLFLLDFLGLFEGLLIKLMKANILFSPAIKALKLLNLYRAFGRLKENS